jgi:hypothetical protein
MESLAVAGRCKEEGAWKVVVLLVAEEPPGVPVEVLQEEEEGVGNMVGVSITLISVGRD